VLSYDVKKGYVWLMNNTTPCYTYDDARRIVEYYFRYMNWNMNNIPGRHGELIAGQVHGFLVLPVDSTNPDDFELMLLHFQNFVTDKKQWIQEKRRQHNCWLPLIQIGRHYLSLPNVMVAMREWDEDWRTISLDGLD
jgi:hypothetical protein